MRPSPRGRESSKELTISVVTAAVEATALNTSPAGIDKSNQPNSTVGVQLEAATCKLGSYEAAGTWKLAAGSWELEACRRKLEAGNWKLETGSWKLEAGSWKLEAGSWKL